MHCTKCRLHKTCKSIKVPGRGSFSPRVMIIGQAPGAQEDKQGKCFVGPAGQLLLQAIRTYGIEKPYITNLVKCAPPGDRDPLPDEIEACKGYLEEEIRRFKPELVVPLGNVALKHFTGEVGIKKKSGKIVHGDGVDFFPIVHPSYILRYPANLPDFERQFQRLAAHMKGGLVSSKLLPPVSLADATRLLKTARDLVAFDYETTGITKTSLGRVRCVGFSTGRDKFWLRADTPGLDAWMRDWLQSDQPKLAHNAVFERRASFENFGVWPRHLRDDTMALHYLQDENTSHALDVLAETKLGSRPWDLGITDWAGVDIMKLGDYCAEDAHQTWELKEHLLRQMTPSLTRLYTKIVMPLSREASFMEQTGMKIDTEWASRVTEKFERACKGYEATFRAECKERGIPCQEDINLNSPVQMRRVFIDSLRLPIKEKTEGGLVSIAEACLEPFRKKYPLVNAYLEWKTQKTLINNFLQKFPTFCDEKGIVHPHINPCFTVTGRLSVREPNAQAIPTNPWVRGIITSRWKGGWIASLDYSQLEMRLVASAAKETKLITAFKNGEDVHGLTARLLFGKDFTKGDRDIAKRINFGIVYGTSSYTLASTFGMSEAKGQALIDRFNKVYPAIFRWMKAQHDLVHKQGFIDSPFGRRRRFGDMSKLPMWQRARMERQGGNFPIQSTGADLTNLCVIEVGAFLRKRKARTRLILQVHDSLLLDVYPGELEDDSLIDVIREIMERNVPRQLKELLVPLKVDVGLGRRWAEWELPEEERNEQ